MVFSLGSLRGELIPFHRLPLAFVGTESRVKMSSFEERSIRGAFGSVSPVLDKLMYMHANKICQRISRYNFPFSNTMENRSLARPTALQWLSISSNCKHWLTIQSTRECSNKNQPVFKKGQSTKGIVINKLNDTKHLQLRPQHWCNRE